MFFLIFNTLSIYKLAQRSTLLVIEGIVTLVVIIGNPVDANLGNLGDIFVVIISLLSIILSIAFFAFVARSLRTPFRWPRTTRSHR